MLPEIFYWLVNMSIAASAAGLILLLLRLIRPLPRRFLFPLWAIVLLRLYFPFSINSRFSLLKWLPHRAVELPTDSFSSEYFSGMNYAQGAVGYYPVKFRSDALQNVFTVASVVWLAAAFLLLFFVVFSYVRTLQQSRRAVYWKENCYLSETVDSPMTCGIFRPRILLPHTPIRIWNGSCATKVSTSAVWTIFGGFWAL